MSFKFFCWFFFFACATLFASSASVKRVRGIYPGDSARYAPNQEFICKNGKRIPWDHVNNNYCDCEEYGDDEPGTSACSSGKFFCPNRGHTSKTIPSAYVNDGFCDCCDGSDEWIEPSKCPNTCQNLAAEGKKKRSEEIAVQVAGLATKKELIQSAKEQIEAKRQELNTLNHELENRRKKKEEVEERKKVAEEAEKKILDERRQKQEEEQKRKEEEQKKLEEEKKAQEPEQATTQETPQGAPQETPQEPAQPNDPNDDEAELSKENDAAPAQDTPPVEKTEEEKEADRLREEYNAASSEFSDQESKVRDITNLLSKNFGSQNQYFYLNEKCFNLFHKEYNYEFCPFSRASQSGTSLGNYAGWEDGEKTQKFDNGQGCWGGPNRSCAVKFTCGTEDKLLSVSEPSKCVYEMVFSTPAACDESTLNFLRSEEEDDERAGAGEAVDYY